PFFVVGSVVTFLFYRYADHRDLPSFPTRRSSDLEALELAHERAHDMGARAGGLATVEGRAGGIADGRGLVERETAGAGLVGGAPNGARAGLRQVLSGGELREDAAGPGAEQVPEGSAVLGQADFERRYEAAEL